MEKLWAGRFKEKTEKTVEGFTESVSFDARLWKHDIEGSIAHVKMLGRQKIISKKDADLIIKGLNQIKTEIQKGKLKFRENLEDVHMNIEHALIKKIGAAGKKIHTARSRNDQVALDMRLYLRDEIREILKLIKGLQKAIVTSAEKHIDIIMPGYTHLQRAQPVLLSPLPTGVPCHGWPGRGSGPARRSWKANRPGRDSGPESRRVRRRVARHDTDRGRPTWRNKARCRRRDAAPPPSSHAPGRDRFRC